MQPRVIFEDEELLVLDKPAGWIINEAKTVGETPVIQTWLRENFDYELAKNREHRSGIVHRLDKETSGILVVAKTTRAFSQLQRQFKSREVQKTYVALAHGKVEPKEGEIKTPVGRLPWNRERFGVLPGGREAETRYRAISNFKFSNSNEKFTLLELYPKTGRTHQIRIHLKYIGHPIVSDQFYAGRKTARLDRQWCPRLFLHASEISFMHPEAGKIIKLQAALSYDLKGVLASLEKTS